MALVVDVHRHQLRPPTVFPSAGSAYTYTSETMSPKSWIPIGWRHALPLRCCPVNALIIRSYMYLFFPRPHPGSLVVAHVACITAMVMFSMTNTSRVNMILVVSRWS